MDVMPLLALLLLVALGVGLLWVLWRYAFAQPSQDQPPGPHSSSGLIDPAAPRRGSFPPPSLSTLSPDLLCEECRHFDYEEGQGLMRAAAPFHRASQFVPMFEMGATATPEGEILARDVPASAAWIDSGLCRKRKELLWGKTDADRRARMKGGDDGSGEPGSFLESGEDCFEPPKGVHRGF